MGVFKLIARIALDVINRRTLITAEQLKNISTDLTLDRCKVMADLLNKKAAEYNVTSTDEFDEFLSNCIQESMEFKHKTENMNYKAETIVKTWPGRFPDINAAAPFAHAPEKLANKVYGFRMGNVLPSDGWKYRGGGFIGITGKETYQKYADYKKIGVEQAAELIRTTDEYAIDSAYWFFYVLKGLKQKSIDDDIIGIVKSINGGKIGLKDRLFYYERVKKELRN